MSKTPPETIYITEKDLPLHCPTPAMTQWNAHPRVYLKVEKTGRATCPYCDTVYILKNPEKVHHHPY